MLYDSYYGEMKYDFVAEETIGGLTVYKFRYFVETFDETEAWIESEYLEPDTTVGVACADVEAFDWVEPTTGEVLKTEENCPREYYFDLASGEYVAPYGRWYYVSGGVDLQRRADEIKSELNDYRMRTLYVPLALLIIGIALSIGGIILIRIPKAPDNG